MFNPIKISSQSDFAEDDPEKLSFILNKPNVITQAERAKLDTIEAGAQVNLPFGDEANTVTEGDDLRLSNDREWLAPTVTFAEAIAGADDFRRAWTAARVRAAIDSVAVPKTGGTFTGNLSVEGVLTTDFLHFSSLLQNTPVGTIALGQNKGGSNNTALGFKALQRNVNGDSNTAVGHSALLNNNGEKNTASGFNSLYSNITGRFNTAHGVESLYKSTGALGNTAVGHQAAYNSEGNFNTVVGEKALFNNINGSSNTALGRNAGGGNNGFNNVFIGAEAGFNETGSNKLHIGNNNSSTSLIFGDFFSKELQVNGDLTVTNDFEVLGSAEFDNVIVDKIENVTSISYSDFSNNLSLGKDALINNTTGVANVAIGSFTLTNNTTGKENTAIGRFSLTANTDGFNNTAVGFNSLLSNIDGNLNSALGDNTLASNTSGSENLALGSSALRDNTTGNGNISLGTRALLKNISGDFNTAIGSGSLASNTTGEGNTAIGRAALNKNITGFNNLAFGKNALGLSEQGISNIAIGSGAGLNCLGSGNIFLGNNAGQNETGSNKLYISNTNTSTPLMLGDISAKELQVNGDLTVTENLEVLGFVESDSFKSSIIQGDRFNTVEIVVDDDLVDVVTPANGGAFVLMYTGANNEPAPQVDSSAMVYYNVGDNPALRSNDAGDGVTIVNNNNPNSIIPNTIVIGADQGIIRIRSTWGDPIIIRMTFIV